MSFNQTELVSHSLLSDIGVSDIGVLEQVKRESMILTSVWGKENKWQAAKVTRRKEAMLKNVKLGVKIIISFGLMMAIAMIIGLVGYRGMNNVMKGTDELAEVCLPSVEHLFLMSKAHQAIARGELELINRRLTNPEIRKAAYENIEAAWKEVDEAVKTYDSLPKSPEETSLWKQLTTEWEQWKSGHIKVMNLSQAKDRLLANGLSLDSQQVVELDSQLLDTYRFKIENPLWLSMPPSISSLL